MRDDVATLVEQLKALPLIESADLTQPGAAYDAFDPLLSAILRAALVQVPEEQRRGKNRVLFERFVLEHFPPGRGRGDDAYAKRLWELRTATVKDKRTASFLLTQDDPDAHKPLSQDGPPVLNLQSLIEDFRAAADHLGEAIRSDTTLSEIATAEVALREVRLTPPETSASYTRSETRIVLSGGARARSGTD